MKAQYWQGCLTLLWVAVAMLGCHRTPPPIPSPDGSMVLNTSVENSRADPGAYLCAIFEIRSTNGTLLHRENTRASVVHRWSLSWGDDSNVLLKSSDIGDYRWRRQPDGTWKKE